MTGLAAGYHMHIDDLVTGAEFRGQGYGSKLFAWLVELATASACKRMRLHSGLPRIEAHEFYLNQGMEFVAKHFDLDLEVLRKQPKLNSI
jgi:GNAT superfamily N-acetyltransferase